MVPVLSPFFVTGLPDTLGSIIVTTVLVVASELVGDLMYNCDLD